MFKEEASNRTHLYLKTSSRLERGSCPWVAAAGAQTRNTDARRGPPTPTDAQFWGLVAPPRRPRTRRPRRAGRDRETLADMAADHRWKLCLLFRHRDRWADTPNPASSHRSHPVLDGR